MKMTNSSSSNVGTEKMMSLAYSPTQLRDMELRNIFLSTNFNWSLHTISVQCCILTMIPAKRQAIPMLTVQRSNSLILICVPVSPNRIGSKIIQNISNAVATGF
jgi:hypothetical protein